MPTIQQAITELPDQFRMVIVLYDIQGLSYQEIGTALRVNVGTIKIRLNRARILLREKLSRQRELFGASDGPTQQVAPMAEKE
jgi:RNA polymerase sigma-70 factor (ECF subfamily)